jgi:hypothetical protein
MIKCLIHIVSAIQISIVHLLLTGQNLDSYPTVLDLWIYTIDTLQFAASGLSDLLKYGKVKSHSAIIFGQHSTCCPGDVCNNVVTHRSQGHRIMGQTVSKLRNRELRSRSQLRAVDPETKHTEDTNHT